MGWWRWIVILVAIFAAVATPTGDPINMALLGGPILILVIVATGVCLLNDRRRARRQSRAGLDFSQLGDDEASSLDLT
jgi:sec-independent protein translocase protein TatC